MPKISALPLDSSPSNDDYIVIVDNATSTTKKATINTVVSGADAVDGPASSTDNAITRFDGATGKLLQNSGIIVSDTNNVTGVGTISSGAITSMGASALGSLSLTTDLPITEGGTGASTAAGALTNLGLTATATELNYTDGVTSAIQTQMDDKTTGAASSTDNAAARFDGTTGKIVQNSSVIIGDSGNVTATSAEVATVKITGGSPGLGKVLTSDADGDASWSAAAVSGITRTVTTITGTTTAGATALTDYVYFINGTNILTMPTAVGNTNLYQLKNITASNTTVASTSAQTFDGSTLVLAPDESVDLVSDNANWRIL